MADKIYDDQAWLCGDCCQLEGSGDLSSFDYWYGDEADVKIQEFLARVEAYRAPKPLVTGKIGENAHGRLSIHLGWFSENHSSECTEEDREARCDCETNPFRSGYCDGCGEYMQGATMHAATIWESES